MYLKKTARDSRRFFVSSFAVYALMLAATSVLCGCGGGGGQPAPPTPDFSLSLSNSSVAVAANGSATVTVSATALNGFDSTVGIAITGLPSGVTITPVNPQVAAGQSVKLTFTAASYLSASTTPLTVTGSNYNLIHTANLSLSVTPYSGNISLPRTRYIRTDSATQLLTWSLIVFNAKTNRYFVTDYNTNQIMVFDAATQTQIGTITVPGAFGIDETPDQTTLYTGTQIGDVYAIDPVGMRVVHRYIASQIGPNGYKAYSVQVLANGSLALLGGQGGRPTIDGYGEFAIWNPADNSIAIYSAGGVYANNCVSENHISELTVTGDRSTVVWTTGDSICTLNPATGKVNSAAVPGLPVVPTPDGKFLLVLQPGDATATSQPAQILVLDTATLSQTAAIQLLNDVPLGSDMLVSPDSSTVFVGTGGLGEPYVFSYDIATGAQNGWVSNVGVGGGGGSDRGSMSGPTFQAMDHTGLLAGVMEEGVGFVDMTALQTGPLPIQTLSSPFLSSYVNPATGPVAGGTPFQIPNVGTEEPAAFYFGKNLATMTSSTETGAVGVLLFDGTTPPGPAGPTDVYGVMTDGELQIIPEGFSYGPTILEAAPNASTAEGGGTGILYGYGFGSTSDLTIPTGLQITVGGKQAPITSYSPAPKGHSPWRRPSTPSLPALPAPHRTSF